MNVGDDIEQSRRNNFIAKIRNELTYLTSGMPKAVPSLEDVTSSKEDNMGCDKTFGLSEGDIEKRINVLNNILNDTISGVPSTYSKKSAADEQRELIYKQLSDHAYKKPWNKLKEIHKIVKIKEFIKDQHGEGVWQTKIIDSLSAYVNDGKLNKCTLVTYDIELAKITSINCLVVNTDGTYKIKI